MNLYIEGGGNSKMITAARKAFHTFFERAGVKSKPQVVPCGPRGDAYNRFRRAGKGALLVDSEVPLSDGSAAGHLRRHDKWDLRDDEAVYLMVVCMESWLVCDPAALAKYYGQGFDRDKLSTVPSIETVDKSKIDLGLKSATRKTLKEKYDKGRDSFALLGQIDPGKVEAASIHARSLLNDLRRAS